MYYKNISYTISHIFVMLFIYLFVESRYTRRRAAAICIGSFLAITIPNVLKLNIFPDSRLCYFLVTIYQIALTQFTGIFISKKRDSRALFVGLTASNYVIAGSIMAAVIHIYTGNLYLCTAGCIVTHIVILYVLYIKIHDIWIGYQERETMNSWWKLCLIPVFFYCGFSIFAFFPYTLDDHPDNIPGVVMFIIAMFMSYVIIMRYMSSEARRTSLYWQNRLFGSYIEGLETEHYLVEKFEKNLRILRHDIRHYSGMIDSLLDQGAYSEIKKVTEHINSVAEENKFTRYCDNLIVNTMFSSLMEKARSLEVEMQCGISVPAEIPVDSYAFAMVIANLMENAINCVRNLEKHRRIVKAKIRCEPDFLLIDIKNEYEDKIDFDVQTGLPRSRRGKDHGMGMQSAQAFSDMINGSIGCYCEDNIFHITLFAKLTSDEICCNDFGAFRS